MYEYKGRMRRDEIALDMARMLRDYQETLEAIILRTRRFSLRLALP